MKGSMKLWTGSFCSRGHFSTFGTNLNGCNVSMWISWFWWSHGSCVGEYPYFEENTHDREMVWLKEKVIYTVIAMFLSLWNPSTYYPNSLNDRCPVCTANRLKQNLGEETQGSVAVEIPRWFQWEPGLRTTGLVSTYGPWTSRIRTSGKLVRNANSLAPRHASWIRKSEGWAQQSVF